MWDPPRVTRSAESEAERMKRKEIEYMAGQEVTNAKEGMRYLESMVPGMPYTVRELVGALFEVSMLPGIKKSWTNINVVRAISDILEDMDMEAKARELAGMCYVP